MTKGITYAAFTTVTALFILLTLGAVGLIIYTILMLLTFGALSLFIGKDRTAHE